MQLPDCMPLREQKADPSPGPRFEKVTKDKKPLHGKAQVEPTVGISQIICYTCKVHAHKKKKTELTHPPAKVAH